MSKEARAATKAEQQQLPNRSEALFIWLDNIEQKLGSIKCDLPESLPPLDSNLDEEVGRQNQLERRGSQLENRQKRLADREYFTTINRELTERLVIGLNKRFYNIEAELQKYGSITLSEYHRIAAVFHQAAQVYFRKESLACQEDEKRFGVHTPLYEIEMALHQTQESYHQAVFEGATNVGKLRRECRAECKKIMEIRHALVGSVASLTTELEPLPPGMYATRKPMSWTVAGKQPPLKPRNIKNRLLNGGVKIFAFGLTHLN